MKFIKLILEIDSIIIGERIKGGVFRHCQTTIPSSTIEGALRHHLSINLKAVGYFIENSYVVKEFTYSVNDKVLETAKMPIFAQYLAPLGNGKILANIFVVDNSEIDCSIFENLHFRMGALRSKDFGKCKVAEIGNEDYTVNQGILKVKIFDSEADDFGIKPISPIYGYLLKPDKYAISGTYQRALFPGSLVNAPEPLIREETYYDE
ncbi:MAG: hypothetical protein ACTSX0_13335 [Promethearchaeota archaeon]